MRIENTIIFPMQTYLNNKAINVYYLENQVTD